MAEENEEGRSKAVGDGESAYFPNRAISLDQP